MDSTGNSGSMQSSSGGDEEYDSRADSFSAFLNPTTNLSSSLLTHSHQLPHSTSAHHPNSSTSTFFDSFVPNYLDPFPRSPPTPKSNPLLNLDVSWPTRTLRQPDHGCTDLTSLVASSASQSSSSNHPIPTAAPIGSSSTSGSYPVIGNPSPSSSPSDQPGATATTSQQLPRGSKKRPRASRRAPTTVLTTDTNNFRQMVQEFTGIPAPPFPSPAFPRSRFDLFNAAAAAAIRSSPGSTLSERPYLLRPFAQKVPTVSTLSPFSTTSAPAPAPVVPPSSTFTGTTSNNVNVTMTSTTANTAAANTNMIGTTPTVCDNGSSTANPSTINPSSTSDHYQLLLGSSDHNHLGLNRQNPIFTLQSLLQSPPPFQNYNLQGMRAPSPMAAAAARHGTNVSSHQMSGHPGLFASEGLASASRGGGSDLAGGGWGDGSGGGVGGGEPAAQQMSSSFGGNDYNNNSSITPAGGG